MSERATIAFNRTVDLLRELEEVKRRLDALEGKAPALGDKETEFEWRPDHSEDRGT